jgi:hypothetical protein
MCGFPSSSTVASASVTWLHSRKYANKARMALGIRNLGLESPAPETCGHLLHTYSELSQEEADTCTSAVEVDIRRSELEADIRRSELEADTSTSGQEVDRCMSELGADRRASQMEACRCIPADVADSRFRAVEGLDAVRLCSIAVAHRRCM